MRGEWVKVKLGGECNCTGEAGEVQLLLPDLGFFLGLYL